MEKNWFWCSKCNNIFTMEDGTEEEYWKVEESRRETKKGKQVTFEEIEDKLREIFIYNNPCDKI